MSDEYQHAARGKLKLKCDSEIKKKKKKKSKDKDKEKLREKVEKSLEQSGSGSGQQQQVKPTGRVLTKAEESFKKMQEKMQKKRIMEKASMTHKQRVEQFNQHLDGLTEHFDIPKVSWTK
ncbi:NBP2b protein [Culex quinquefasciatus]|uniref:NBP2b protein n=1 Tax=Culex quinquefasciatus TaxID=7176 RepID=B0X8L9_CULQU|nr:protein FAM32A [Culex quinquefasciatus]EDS42611.1 NBP2b protein [Culex quinquefasciatus]|eukprot:XP_001865991.1 NBP2b protein [Culex quinquefasciatus]